MPADAGAVSVAFDGSAGRLRRRLGPNAWIVLEELLLAGTLDATAGPVVVVRATVRELAERTALSKDTVARAIQKLRAAAVVAAETERHDNSGRFASVRYLIDPRRLPLRIHVAAPPVEPADVRVAPVSLPASPQPTSRPVDAPKPVAATVRRAAHRAPDGQLSMLG